MLVICGCPADDDSAAAVPGPAITQAEDLITVPPTELHGSSIPVGLFRLLYTLRPFLSGPDVAALAA